MMTQQLFFFVTSNISEATRSGMESFVRQLEKKRKWTIAEPQFVSEIDKSTKLETLGAVMKIHCAYPPNNVRQEIDLAEFKDVEYLVSELEKLSKEKNLIIEFQLDEKFVGEISHGTPDSVLSIGFIGEWRRVLEGMNLDTSVDPNLLKLGPND